MSWSKPDFQLVVPTIGDTDSTYFGPLFLAFFCVLRKIRIAFCKNKSSISKNKNGVLQNKSSISKNIAKHLWMWAGFAAGSASRLWKILSNRL